MARNLETQPLTTRLRMNLTRPSALRFVLVAMAVVLGGVAQYLIGNGNLRWAATPCVVAVAAMALAVANRPLSRFTVGRARPDEALEPARCGRSISLPGVRLR